MLRQTAGALVSVAVATGVAASPAAAASYPPKPPVPVSVTTKATAPASPGGFTRLIREIDTPSGSELTVRIFSRPLAAGEKRYCKAKVGRKNSVSVKCPSGLALRVTLVLRVTPTGKKAKKYGPSVTRYSWILKNNTYRKV